MYVSQNKKCKKIIFCSVITNIGVYKPLRKIHMFKASSIFGETKYVWFGRS